MDLRWRRLLPWAAAAGVIVGITFGDYTLVILAILLFAGAYFWPAAEEDGEE